MKKDPIFADLGEFRVRLADFIAIANYGNQDIILARRGCPVARLVGLSDAEKESMKKINQGVA